MAKRSDLSLQDAQVAEIIESARKDKFLTVEKLCKLLNMSKGTYYKKLYAFEKFTVGQVRDLKRILELSQREIRAFY